MQQNDTRTEKCYTEISIANTCKCSNENVNPLVGIQGLEKGVGLIR